MVFRIETQTCVWSAPKEKNRPIKKNHWKIHRKKQSDEKNRVLHCYNKYNSTQNTTLISVPHYEFHHTIVTSWWLAQMVVQSFDIILKSCKSLDDNEINNHAIISTITQILWQRNVTIHSACLPHFSHLQGPLNNFCEETSVLNLLCANPVTVCLHLAIKCLYTGNFFTILPDLCCTFSKEIPRHECQVTLLLFIAINRRVIKIKLQFESAYYEKEKSCNIVILSYQWFSLS